MNDTLFFVGDVQVVPRTPRISDLSGGNLWKSDGTANGTVLVKIIDPNQNLRENGPNNLTALNSTLFFTANDDVHGYELWKSDGTAEGTVLVKDIYPGNSHGIFEQFGSPPYDFTNMMEGRLASINGILYFGANDGVNGQELWQSNGTETGTVLVSDINPGIDSSTDVRNFTILNGTLFFTADDGVHGSELWKLASKNTLDPQLSLFNFVRYSQFFNLPNPIEIVVNLGLSENIPLLFDESYYLMHNPDVAAGVSERVYSNGFQHFLAFGQFEGRNPSVLYNEGFYLSHNPDVANAVSSDLISSGFQHFLDYGIEERRDPSALFNENEYLGANLDVADVLLQGNLTSGFQHYLKYGLDEGRTPRIALFEEHFYLSNNADVNSAVSSGQFLSGFDHYIRYGQYENRTASSLFDNSSYLALNPDVSEAINLGTIGSGFEHYVSYGCTE